MASHLLFSDSDFLKERKAIDIPFPGKKLCPESDLLLLKFLKGSMLSERIESGSGWGGLSESVSELVGVGSRKTE